MTYSPLVLDDVTATAPLRPRRAQGEGEVWALVVLWLADGQRRVGETFLIEGPSVIGRGRPRGDDPQPRVMPGVHRPGMAPSVAPLEAPAISRVQLAVTPGSGRLVVENRGRCPLTMDGVATDRAEAQPGAVLELQNQLLLMVTRRPARLATAPVEHRFGDPDPYGIVGEGPVTWALRQRIVFAANRSAHVLVHGPSGTGKELVANALHAASSRAGMSLVARNAATLPVGLVDAELFGSARDYPHRGARERSGLIGAADRSTLFLDEIGELPEELQAHLLRVLDAGEYHRLGESTARRVDMRLIAATNRNPEVLKHDLLARLVLRVEVPGLDTRREDIPLICRALIARIGAGDLTTVERFLDGGDLARPRFSPDFIQTVVRADYATHVRQLLGWLWAAIEHSPEDWIEPPPGVKLARSSEPRDPASVTAEMITEALARNEGQVTRAAADLGLATRHVLARLMKKYGLR
jgi:two-component system nitrogen regulation response regulator GlnG/two-component system response regulator HydG